VKIPKGGRSLIISFRGGHRMGERSESDKGGAQKMGDGEKPENSLQRKFGIEVGGKGANDL